jgi:hypothetical protein
VNDIQLELLKSKGYTFVRTEQRGSRLVSIAIKPRPDGKGDWKAEADGMDRRDAERNLVLTVTRK